MNPATPGPLTVLLIAPPGDTALLADECGGRVPWAHQTWREDYGSPDGGTWSEEWTIGDADTSHEPAPHTALVLVHEGTPVAMGCDRAVRVCRTSNTKGGDIAYWSTYTVEDAIHIAREAERRIGARVVLLRDGREVPNV